jgi:hypothetical protein
MYSKSLLTNNSNLVKTILNPIGESSTQNIFSLETLSALRAVQQFYTFNMSSKSYDKIPTDYDKFLHLFHIIHSNYQSITNPALRLLFKITEEGLIGALNSYGMNYTTNQMLDENASLKKTIEDLLSKVNIKPAFPVSQGNMSIQKTFTLAPLFSYYIMLYGMPERGVGFDQVKLSSLLEVLEKQCIDPYDGKV